VPKFNKMPTKLKRCGRCSSCKGKICHPTSTTRCLGCKFPSRKEGCHLRQPCVRQVTGAAQFKALGEETTSASENESNSRHRYPTRLSMSSDNDEGACDPASIAMETISSAVSKLGHISLTNITTDVSTRVTNTPTSSNSDSLDQTLIRQEVLPKKAILPPYMTNWEMSQVSDHNFSPAPLVPPILKRRESNIGVPINAASTPTRSGQSVKFTPPPDLGTIPEQPSFGRIKYDNMQDYANHDMSNPSTVINQIVEKNKQMQIDRQLQLSLQNEGSRVASVGTTSIPLQPKAPASVEEIQEDPTHLATVRSMFKEFLDQLHPNHIGQFEEVLNQIDLTSDKSIEQIFDMIARKVFDLDNTADVTKEVKLYCNTLSSCIDKARQVSDWNHSCITGPINHLRNALNQMAIDRLDAIATAQADAEALQRKNFLAFSQCNQPVNAPVNWKYDDGKISEKPKVLPQNPASSRLPPIDDVLTEVESHKKPLIPIPSGQKKC